MGSNPIPSAKIIRPPFGAFFVGGAEVVGRTLNRSPRDDLAATLRRETKQHVSLPHLDNRLSDE